MANSLRSPAREASRTGSRVHTYALLDRCALRRGPGISQLGGVPVWRGRQRLRCQLDPQHQTARSQLIDGDRQRPHPTRGSAQGGGESAAVGRGGSSPGPGCRPVRAVRDPFSSSGGLGDAVVLKDGDGLAEVAGLAGAAA